MKPTEYDISFKYICLNCGFSHWIFLREAQTKDFKIVCECESVLYPDTIKSIDIVYDTDKDISDIDIKINKQCLQTLLSFGYSQAEASDLVKKSFDIVKINDSHKIIECALKLGSN